MDIKEILFVSKTDEKLFKKQNIKRINSELVKMTDKNIGEIFTVIHDPDPRKNWKVEFKVINIENSERIIKLIGMEC